MARYVLIALNGPTSGEGDEAIYNEWYHEVHIPDLLATPGVTSAKRYRTVFTKSGSTQWPYAAIYEIETDDLQAVYKHMRENNRPFHPAFDLSQSEAITAVLIED